MVGKAEILVSAPFSATESGLLVPAGWASWLVCASNFTFPFVPLSFSQNRSCDSFRPFVGGDDFRICCDCCALGIKAKTDYDVSCSVDLFPVNAGKTSSSQCIKAFKQCCNGKKMLQNILRVIFHNEILA